MTAPKESRTFSKMLVQLSKPKGKSLMKMKDSNVPAGNMPVKIHLSRLLLMMYSNNTIHSNKTKKARTKKWIGTKNKLLLLCDIMKENDVFLFVCDFFASDQNFNSATSFYKTRRVLAKKPAKASSFNWLFFDLPIPIKHQHHQIRCFNCRRWNSR